MDYETSPTAKYEKVIDDSHSEKTGSEGSEGFVKLDQVIDEPADQPPAAEKSSDKAVTRPDVETVPATTDPDPEKNRLEDDPTREKYLRDYYEQLPTETEASGDREVVDDVAEVPVKPPPVEDVGVVGEDEVHDEEMKRSDSPSTVESNQEPQFVSVRDANSAGSPGKQQESGALEGRRQDVVDLVFWRDVRMSAFVFTLSLLVLLSLRCFSVIAVVAYLALSLLTVTVTFRLYKIVLQTINGTQQPNPFQSLLDTDVSISQQQVQRYSEALLDHVNVVITNTRDLLLVRNLASSLKFGLLMWMLTYVGGWFNGLTLITLELIFVFALPPFYEKYQKPLDNYYELAHHRVADVYKLVRSKIPGGTKQKTQ